MKLVAQSFSWPFRGAWKSRWIPGLVATLVLPVGFVPLLGYAIAATRQAELDPATGPPEWRFSWSLLRDGLWTAAAVALFTTPFVLLVNPLAERIFDAGIWHVADTPVAQLYSHTAAFFLLALPWGLLLLIHMPHATAWFAQSRAPRHLFDVVASIRAVTGDFATWNLAAAAMVTGWAIGLACVGVLCVGLVPGVLYAILVSAHASAALHHQGATPPAG
jgi:Protein of unknown function (DUF4013)